MTEHLTICTIGVTIITIIVTYSLQLHKLSANVNSTMVLCTTRKRWVYVSCEPLTHYHIVPSLYNERRQYPNNNTICSKNKLHTTRT